MCSRSQLMKNNIALLHSDAFLLCSNANEVNTVNVLNEMDIFLAQGVVNYICVVECFNPAVYAAPAPVMVFISPAPAASAAHHRGRVHRARARLNLRSAGSFVEGLIPAPAMYASPHQ